MIAVTDRHLFDAEPDPEGAFLEALAGLLNPSRPLPGCLSPGRPLSDCASTGRPSPDSTSPDRPSPAAASALLPPRFLVLREKDLPEPAYRALAEKVLSLPNPGKTPIVLHNFPGAAESLPAQGLHLSLPRLEQLAEESPELLRRFPLLGCSVHKKEEALRAVSLGVNYLFAGNVFETSCKPGLPSRGLPWLEDLAAAVPVPVYAIGGVTPENLPSLLSAGASDGCMRSGYMELGRRLR